MDMEFVQFHPTGMVWPPSVQGILVTEAVRGEGGILLNSEGTRFMFQDIPENYRAQTAADEEEGWRYTQGDKSARRPPELLTRDHVARCIMREVREGRGSPHGGVFLDIAWIRARVPDAAGHIKKRLPAMYHQFLQLADVDITKQAMEVGPTTHYMMGGVRVDGETQMSTLPGLFAAGECAAGLHGANRLGGNSLSDLLVFGKRAGEFAARFAREAPIRSVPQEEIARAARRAVAPFEPAAAGPPEAPYELMHRLQQIMQHHVGIVREEPSMRQGLEAVLSLRERVARAAAGGNRHFNPGWHTALDLPGMITVAEAITRAALERKESRGAHFREDFPGKDPEEGKVHIIVARGTSGEMVVRREPIPPLPEPLRAILQEMG
jgi:succinate dehydrogenase / fumarate reductase flavoprotein subunit